MLAKMTDFALFREPHATHALRYVQTQGEAQSLPNYDALNNVEGFVFAPFTISDECPLLVIASNRVEKLDATAHISRLPQSGNEVPTEPNNKEKQSISTSYQQCFRSFHQELMQARFAKIVLSRTEDVALTHAADAEQLFWRACQRYPRSFIALVCTRKAGTWLMLRPKCWCKTTHNDGTPWHWRAR